ncbi:MAG: NAD(P)/FAD-dependent oxidoreductase [Lacunisphaera sp.]
MLQSKNHALTQENRNVMQETQENKFNGRSPDVVVIGGGPGGSTMAAVLADKGYDVVVFEKAHHPRFHIGESLLPMNMPLFDRLGLRQAVEQIGIMKYGAEFVSPYHDHTSNFDFADALDKNFPYSVQVRRSELDELLFRHAASRGARTFEGCRVGRVDFENDQGPERRPIVKVKGEDGVEQEWRPRFVIDASGRDTLLSNQLSAKKRHPKHTSAALFGHFRGARRAPGRREGNISLFWFDHGWFWYIPLRDGTTSIGAVASPKYFKTRQSDPSTFLMETIALAPKLAERLVGATLLEPATATGNYAYDSKFCRGDRFMLVGDAFAFVDPMFSTGVYLAMNSAFEGSKAVDHWLKGEMGMANKCFKNYDRLMVHGPKIFSWFIYRITSPAIRNLFMYPRNLFRMQEAMLSILAGDVYRHTPVWPRLMAFKCIYYLSCLGNFPNAFQRWKWRRGVIKDSLNEPLKVEEKF